MIEKFPVTSKSGVKYLAQVSNRGHHFFGEILEVELFIETRCKNIFGIEKVKFETVFDLFFEKHEPEYISYVQAVKKTVYLYEKSIQDKIDRQREEESLRIQMDSEFNKWNGEC